MRYRVPFIFGRDRADAEKITFDFLRHFHRDRVRELEALGIQVAKRNIPPPPLARP